MKRRRFLLVAAALLAFGGGYCWWQSQLTSAERQLVGTWVCHDTYDNGSSCVRTWDVRPDGTAHFHNDYHWVATNRAAAKDEVDEGEFNWSYRGGRLIVLPQHPSLKKARVLIFVLERRVRNMFRGVSEIVMDNEGSYGRLSHIDGGSFTVHWWNPDKKLESPPVSYRKLTTEN